MPSPEIIRYVIAPLFTPFGALAIGGFALFVYGINYMRPRRYYIVRHGETILNAQHIKQGAEGSLNDAGKAQAERVGKSLTVFGIQKILSSPYQRAKETSEILNKYLGVSISYSPLLAERKNPSEVIGKNRDDADVVHIIDTIDLSYHEDDYRYSDEENFADLKKRAKKCLTYMGRHNARDICVVTHHAFLKMLLSYMTYRERLHAGDYVKLSFFNMSDNGGVSVCEYHPWLQWNKTRGWEVISFNDTL